jgi:hypothetical protein
MHAKKVGIAVLAITLSSVSCVGFLEPGPNGGSSLMQAPGPSAKNDKPQLPASAADSALLADCEYRIRVCDLRPESLNSDLELSRLVSALKTALKRAPEDTAYTQKAYRLLGLAYWIKGNQFGARQTLQSLDTLSGYGRLPAAEDPAPTLRSRFIQDNKKRLRFLQSSSEAMLWPSEDAIPADLLLELAMTYLGLGNKKEALPIFEKVFPRLDQRTQDLYAPSLKRAQENQ